ncbi:TetR family transcriptional regulator [Phycicoccus endophyticus]|uniref:TetR family transcriptional regulator n=1 Tax=Phycicoccus endophyticus TaxID=1690220 RepID=A0A7G9R1G1_9MICO|nr:TetR family transcriptional regulator [Phycicoccus endophyticus]NHI18777.1 TetR family transcriptional regulator [Phycicoccus endophyticus]QNN49436.1 TetR family transcriptional regulator [Phycicoccus endophyticus]GGL36628.1 TetR family transcriptional regulator [Phycicoccus endophyticus]
MKFASTGLGSRLRNEARAEVARVALELAVDRGFDEVTVSEIAQAAGISRATFFRYFDGKNDAVLASIDGIGNRIAAAVLEQPDEIDAWTALSRATAAVVGDELADADRSLARARLVTRTTSLRARELEKQHRWQEQLRAAIAARSAAAADDIRVRTLSAAALAALQAATDAWVESDGRLSPKTLLEQAFAALRAPQ